MTEYTIADMMQAYAEDALDLAQQLNVELNFTEESLIQLDQILEQYHKGIPKGIKKIFSRGPSEEQIDHMAKIWGGYLGETIIRQYGGEWTMSSAFENTVTLRVGNSEIYPVTKIYKRIMNGPEDDVHIFYKLMKQDWDK